MTTTDDDLVEEVLDEDPPRARPRGRALERAQEARAEDGGLLPVRRELIPVEESPPRDASR